MHFDCSRSVVGVYCHQSVSVIIVMGVILQVVGMHCTKSSIIINLWILLLITD